MSLQNLIKQRDDILRQRAETERQFQQASLPVTVDEANRYLTQMAGNFQPLKEERRGLMAAATQTLPSQIQDYVQQRNAGAQAPSSLTALNSIFRNQANTQQTANLLGDMIDTGRGNLNQLANSAMQQLGQKQDSFRYLLGRQDNDLNRLLGQIEAEKDREEARRARASAAALQQQAFQNQQDQLNSTLGGPITLEADAEKNQVQGFQNMLNNASDYWNKRVSRPITQKLYRAALNLKNRGVPGLGFVGNGRNITEDLLRGFGIRR